VRAAGCAGRHRLLELDIYVGVSSGAFIASMLANGFSPADLREILVEAASHEHAISPAVFLTPAVGEIARRAASLPRLALETLWHRARDPFGADAGKSLSRVARAIPTGFLDNERMGRFLEQAFRSHGSSNDFRDLQHKLRLVATDLDTGEAVASASRDSTGFILSRCGRAPRCRFCTRPCASAAASLVDGALRKTLHASVALRDGAPGLLRQPADPVRCQPRREPQPPAARKAVPAACRSYCHDLPRPDLFAHAGGNGGLCRQYRGGCALFQPRRIERRDVLHQRLQLANRHRVFRHAYQSTLRDLWARRRELAPRLARHGIAIRDDAVLSGTTPPPRRGADSLPALAAALDRLERWVGRTERASLRGGHPR
jgi:hypothetical protein